CRRSTRAPRAPSSSAARTRRRSLSCPMVSSRRPSPARPPDPRRSSSRTPTARVRRCRSSAPHRNNRHAEENNMTTATAEGRRLMLRLEGIDTPIAVDPLPAKRGRVLTEQFIGIAAGKVSGALAEQVLIEAINPHNYARISGEYVDEFDAAGAYVQTWGPEGAAVRPALADTTGPDGIKYAHRDAFPDEAPVDGEPIRQEEAETLCMAAFYWQTVVGMEGVTAFLEGGE